MEMRIRRFITTFWFRHRIKIVLGGLILLFFVAYLWNNIFYTITPGQAGVRWSRFFGGTVLDRVYLEGMHAIVPWDKMYIYDLRIQELHDVIEVLSQNGLSIEVDWSGRFFPNPTRLPLLHKRLGPNYREHIVKPEFISAIRRVLGNYTEEEIYSKDEERLLSEIYNDIKEHLQHIEHLVTFHDILFKKLLLPPSIQAAIQDKITQKHIALSYKYRLQKEEKEKERRKIEAEGIQQFERISGIPILKWRGIQATEKLAESENAKIIVIGTGPDGLPIILNADK